MTNRQVWMVRGTHLGRDRAGRATDEYGYHTRWVRVGAWALVVRLARVTYDEVVRWEGSYSQAAALWEWWRRARVEDGVRGGQAPPLSERGAQRVHEVRMRHDPGHDVCPCVCCCVSCDWRPGPAGWVDGYEQDEVPAWRVRARRWCARHARRSPTR